MRMLIALSLVALTACTGEPPPAPPEIPPPPPPKAEPISLPVKGILDVISTKNETAEVPGRFEGVSGTITTTNPGTWAEPDGKVDIAIASWTSGLELRDTRVRTTFFEEAGFATATFDLDGLAGLPEGGLAVGAEAPAATLSGKLTLHGASKDISLPVKVKRVGDQAFTVESTAPFALNSDDFGLAERREALRAECEHQSLSAVAKVSLRIAVGAAEVPGVVPPAVPPEGAGEKDTSGK